MRKVALALIVMIIFLAGSPRFSALASHAATDVGLRGDPYNNADFTTQKITPTIPTPRLTATPTITPSATPTATPSPLPSAAKVLFGIGPEADSAIRARLVQESPVHLLTSWYNSPADLAWMTGWRYDLVPQAYGSGSALHLIVFSDDPEIAFPTSYGQACGRPYPLSDRFLDDMRRLAQTFAGTVNTPPLYVTLFTEVQTYACTDNAWFPDSESNNYYRALKDRYRAAYAVFHQYAPNVRVSLGWGGWQARWSDPAIGGGRAMIDAFADVLYSSDFQSFQAMQADTNVNDVRAMVNILGAYGPVMLAHYKPDNGSAATFDADVRAMLTDAYLTEITAAGLFAWSFMDETNLAQSESVYQFTKDAVVRYGTAAP
jgi:hypothetical protein